MLVVVWPQRTVFCCYLQGHVAGSGDRSWGRGAVCGPAHPVPSECLCSAGGVWAQRKRWWHLVLWRTRWKEWRWAADPQQHVQRSPVWNWTYLWSLRETVANQLSFVPFFRQNQPSQGGDDVPWFPLWPPAEQLPATPGSPELPGAILPRAQHPTPHQGESTVLTPVLNTWCNWIEFKNNNYRSPVCQFNTAVEKVTPVVVTTGGERVRTTWEVMSSDSSGCQRMEIFDSVFVCSGWEVMN